MRKRISDLLDACQDDSVELSGNTPLSSARIKEMTMNKITPKKKHLYRLPARLLAAAAIAAALTASAFAAVYIAGAGELMQDFFTKDGPGGHGPARPGPGHGWLVPAGRKPVAGGGINLCLRDGGKYHQWV